MKNFILILIVLGGLGYIGYRNYYIPYYIKNQLDIVDKEGMRIKFPENQPYILGYIQSWCRDCIAETPCLVEFSQKNHIPLFFVTDEDSGLMKRYRKRFEYELPIYYAQKKFRDHGILLFPTVLFYDASGNKIFSKMERIDSSVLTQYLEQLKR